MPGSYGSLVNQLDQLLLLSPIQAGVTQYSVGSVDDLWYTLATQEVSAGRLYSGLLVLPTACAVWVALQDLVFPFLLSIDVLLGFSSTAGSAAQDVVDP